MNAPVVPLKNLGTLSEQAAPPLPPGGIDGLDSTLRVNNSIVYTSPEMQGLKFSMQYGVGGIAGSLGSGSTIAAAARYLRGPLSLATGYVRITNADSGSGGFSSSSSATFFTSVINQGYLSAHTIQQIVAYGNYRFGNLTVGTGYANVAYRPDGKSSFGSSAIFNIYGGLAAYQFTPAFSLAAGSSFTRASQANGITDAARYFQCSFQENYSLSKRTTIYLLQAYQHARGRLQDPREKGTSFRPCRRSATRRTLLRLQQLTSSSVWSV
ncbi:porin [Paraburkholderia sp. SIMBA_053]|uniref:porin n=1 Tax=Paraburkholderia sp. SIMBA_053 TaxID=3085794 RepID=UPI0039790790